jgi:hypothetical protein
MPNSKADRVLIAYFERPAKEYVRTLESIKASGGLTREEVAEIRAAAPAVHADAILRHLAANG